MIEKGELSDVMKALGLDPSKKQLDEMMKAIDSDKNAAIDFNEFVLTMQSSSDNHDDEIQENAEKELKAEMDANRQNRIGAKLWIGAKLCHHASAALGKEMARRLHGISEEQLAEIRKAFDLFDTNKNGKIEKTELSQVMMSLGLDPTKQSLDEMMKSVDLNQNNVIEFEEFVLMMQSSSDCMTGSHGHDPDGNHKHHDWESAQCCSSCKLNPH